MGILEDATALQGKLVQVSWNFKAGQGYPHPDDEGLLRDWPGHLVARLELVRDGYLFLNYFDELKVRLVPFSVVAVPEPKFKIGTCVVVQRSEKHSEFRSTVQRFLWHFKDEIFYYILVGKSKRYAEGDLTRVAPSYPVASE